MTSESRDETWPAEPPRSWWQFSLRILLVVTALVAIVFGLWIVPAERQRAAVAELRAYGIPVFYASEGREGRGFPDEEFNGWLPLDYWRSPVSIHNEISFRSGYWHPWDNSIMQGAHCRVSDVGLIANFHSLRRLYVYGGEELDDQCLERISQMAQLEELGIYSDKVTARGIAALTRLAKLKFLRLGVTPEAATGIAKLGPLVNLEQLWLARPIDQRFFANLPAFPKLRVLVCEVGDIANSIDAPDPPTDESRAWSAKMDMTNVARLSKLEWLDLSMTNVDDRGLEQLAGSSSLQHLRLYSTQVSDRAMEVIARFPQLEELDVSYTQITDRGLAVLAKSPSLKYVAVHSVQVTEPGEAELRKRFPEGSDPNLPVP